VDVSKGSKTDLTAARYLVDLDGAAGLVDLAAVLLGADGRVRGDDDMVFFNNPRQPGVALTPAGAVEIDLDAVPADVERVLVTGSTEAQGAKFGEVGALVVGVRGSGQALTFAPAGLDSETVLQMVALYRRGPGWRLDAIGQGYAQGLAAFATEHGIDVDDEPEAAPPAAAPVPERISVER
jgi:tellurite resistance protein TerA